MSDYFKLKATAHAILRDNDGKVLFMRRSNTGYMDGKLGLPSGHVEQNESFKSAAVRELQEEAGISADEKSVDHTITLHRYQPAGQHDYVDSFFSIKKWEGMPIIAETDKCSEIVWAHPKDVRSELVSYLTHVFDAIDRQDVFIEIQRGDDE
jgi:mutator protein MutT